MTQSAQKLNPKCRYLFAKVQFIVKYIYVARTNNEAQLSSSKKGPSNIKDPKKLSLT